MSPTITYAIDFLGDSWTSLEIPTRRVTKFASLDEANKAAQRYLGAYTIYGSHNGEYDENGLWNGSGESFLVKGEEMGVEVCKVEEMEVEEEEEGVGQRRRTVKKKGGRKKGRR